MYHPIASQLMDNVGKPDFTPIDLLSYLAGRDASRLNENNYIDFLDFDLTKKRSGILDHFGIENYSSYYIANQIVRAVPGSKVILVDGRRRCLDRVIKEEGKKPEAVFITTISSNFPTAVAASIPLNHARIPVIIGGIHVSTSPSDVDIFIKAFVPHPELVSQVRGAGDSGVITELLSDIGKGSLKPEYNGFLSVEDGMWGSENVIAMPEMRLEFLKKLPFIGNYLAGISRLNVATPYIGCPFSCRFCSISTLPKNQRKFTSRTPQDFLNELKSIQEGGANLKNRFFFFLPDNFILGGKKLEEILDGIIDSDLKLNYAVQISIDVAEDKRLLEKMRRSGASHFFIGLESLDIRNLEYIGKNAVKGIKKSGLTVSDYYSMQLRKIINHGISVHGAFICGLPYDYFNSLDDHTGREIAEFCMRNRIGIQPGSLTDLPGSVNFLESQKDKTCLYGEVGTMDYLLALSITDLSEMNRMVPDSLKNSPLVVAYMVYDAVKMVGSTTNAIRSALYMAVKAWLSPTKCGRNRLYDRFVDSLGAIAFQLGVSAYKDVGEALVCSGDGIRGTFERLYEFEKNQEVKEIFKDYVEKFKE
jgi:hypothetical protein